MSSTYSRTLVLLAAAAALAIGSYFVRGSAADNAPARGCKPADTSWANAPEQKPAFPGQTRACEEKLNVAFDVVVLSRELEHPWAVEPLPDGDLLVTERPGRMRIVTADGKTGAPIQGVPAVVAKGQGGLLDVALSPGFASDRTIFWSYSEPREDGNGTSVARAVLAQDRSRLEDVRVILRTRPSYSNNLHFGSRLVFAADGTLFVTLGERSEKRMRPQAQELGSHYGKILRITADGAAPPDNPFVGQAGALPEIWSLGHRNIQSAAIDSRGRLWEIEHGTRGGDELNLVEKGKNYGWPLVAYGEEYVGFAIDGAETDRPGYERPVYYWDPVIAPSGAEFYSGDAFPQWRGSLFIGGLKTSRLVRLTLQNDRVTGEEYLLGERRQRIRDVRQGGDGLLYVVTDEPEGQLWKLAPRS
ncbi:MAG TPA: PQQ-dependent sugar dehydrogenase [Candidatus Limnocylindrales bacterium]|nr:PQQ-dependent sugar dehydrogenase [Candidatus Limnocylindrales bacterium]